MYVASLLILHCILHSLVDYPSPADADYKPISSNEETNIVCCRIQKSINAFNTHLWLHYLFIYFKFNCEFFDFKSTINVTEFRYLVVSFFFFLEVASVIGGYTVSMYELTTKLTSTKQLLLFHTLLEVYR